MMSMPGIARSIVVAGLGLFLLAGPVAFQQGCQMTNCCCQPEATERVSLEKTPCCGCQISKVAQMPIQLATAQKVDVPDHIRTEMSIAFTGEIAVAGSDDFSCRFIETQSLSPPLSISSINTPLIC